MLMENRPEYFEVCWAAQRSGLFYTAINHHFTVDEAAYILDDCDAQVLVISDAYRELATELASKMPNVRIRLMVGDQLVDGYEPYAEARDRYPRRTAGRGDRGHADALLVGHDRPTERHQVQDHEGADRCDARARWACSRRSSG